MKKGGRRKGTSKSVRPGRLRALSRHKLIVQIVEYLIGGGVYFWTGLAIFTLLYSVFHWHWLPAKAVADGVGWTLNYLIQRYWAFNDRRLTKHEGRARFRYIIINTLDFIFDYAIVAGMQQIGYSPYIGFLVSASTTTVWDYFWYKYWVFKPQN